MSLKSPRLIAPFSVIGLAALIVSCGQQSNSPTSPTSFGSSLGIQRGVTEMVVTLADDAPAPVPTEGEPIPPPADPGARARNPAATAATAAPRLRPDAVATRTAAVGDARCSHADGAVGQRPDAREDRP